MELLLNISHSAVTNPGGGEDASTHISIRASIVMMGMTAGMTTCWYLVFGTFWKLRHQRHSKLWNSCSSTNTTTALKLDMVQTKLAWDVQLGSWSHTQKMYINISQNHYFLLFIATLLSPTLCDTWPRLPAYIAPFHRLTTVDGIMEMCSICESPGQILMFLSFCILNVVYIWLKSHKIKTTNERLCRDWKIGVKVKTTLV